MSVTEEKLYPGRLRRVFMMLFQIKPKFWKATKKNLVTFNFRIKNNFGFIEIKFNDSTQCVSLLSWTTKKNFFLNSDLSSLIISLGFRSLENICNNRKCKYNLTRKLVYCKFLQFLPVYLMLYCPKENKVDERKQIEVSIAFILIVFLQIKKIRYRKKKAFFSFFGHFVFTFYSRSERF